MSLYNSIRSMLIFNDGFIHSLTSESTRNEQPAHVKINLYSHQLAVLHEMKQKEVELNKGMDISGTKLFSSYAILGDGVGVGKSLMILGHISNLKKQDPIQTQKQLTDHSNRAIYSIEEQNLYKDCSNAGCLIVVPHTLYKQWEKYITTQSTLSFYGVKTKAYLEDEKWKKQSMLTKDVVLVSNTLYGKLQAIMSANKVSWKRVFFDEADTLTIPSTQEIPKSKFIWFVSASWPNLLFPNSSIYFTPSNMATLTATVNLDPELRTHMQSWRTRDYPSGYNFTHQHYHLLSLPFFRSILQSDNRYRGRIVVRCRDSFVQESISLPPLYTTTIMCRSTVALRVVANAITPEVRQLLHAGDYAGALTHLGVKAEDSMTLIQAVTENRAKELERLEKTYEFKNSLEYATPQSKEYALTQLRQKIDGLKEQIKVLKERIENYKEEICPICFDEPQSAVITNCCHRIFCAACILTSLTRANTCPLCRATIHTQELRSLGTGNKVETVGTNKEPELLKKTDQLLKILQEILSENRDARFLVFSRFDNPLHAIGQDLATHGIRYAQVHGNKDVINHTLSSFQKGETRVLLLNSLMAGAGMNITEATHVILLHAMNHEEEKQIIGRAYRMGRKGPLNLIRLLHSDEVTDTHQIH